MCLHATCVHVSPLMWDELKAKDIDMENVLLSHYVTTEVPVGQITQAGVSEGVKYWGGQSNKFLPNG